MENSKLTKGGIKFAGYNKPKMTPSHPTKKAAVLAKDGTNIKLVRFGLKGYGNNYSPEARKNYLARSAGIKNGNNKLGANFWSRSFLWKAGGQVTKATKAHPNRYK